MPFPDFHPRPCHVHRFAITREVFAELPSEVRIAAIILGSIANEISTLYRVIILSSQIPTDPTERSYQTMQFSVLSRLLIGKVAEGCQFFQNRLLSQPATRSIVAKIEEQAEGKALVKRIKLTNGRKGFLTRIRNEHVFHHPSDEALEKAFEKVGSSDADWSFLTAEQAHTLCFPAANTISLLAMLNDVDDNHLTANQLLSSETMDLSGSLLEFAQAFYVALQDEFSLVSSVKAVRDTTSQPAPKDCQIPPLLRST